MHTKGCTKFSSNYVQILQKYTVMQIIHYFCISYFSVVVRELHD